MKEGRKIVSVSGGKDSTAMCLHLFEEGYSIFDFDRVFMDTGWEDKSTYDYLNDLEGTIGPIIRLKLNVEINPEDRQFLDLYEERLGTESPFVRLVLKYNAFPSSIVKWCTRRLKIEPLKQYYQSLDYDYINIVGIRKEESKRRSQLSEWEWNDGFDCWVWRPLINWKEEEVIAIHHRFNLMPNRLYLQGNTRVGCYPCINANKSAIKNLSSERVEIIRDLESLITERRARKNKGAATFFKQVAIDDAKKWSQTTRGGKQFELFAKEEPTCVRWGMCGV